MADKNELTQKETTENLNIIPGFCNLQSFELSQRVAVMLSKSTLIPKEYQENLSNCIIALNMASRMGADPLMVMQNLYIVHGKPGWSSQFLISTFNTCGRFSSLRYEWLGTVGTDSWGCRAWTVEKATGEKLEGASVTIDLAKKEGWYSKAGSKWQTMPQQMLMYRAASWLIRAYAPELAMGMHTEDEIVDIGEADFTVKEIKQNANKQSIDIVPKPTQEPVKTPDPVPQEQPQQEQPTGTDGPDF